MNRVEAEERQSSLSEAPTVPAASLPNPKVDNSHSFCDELSNESEANLTNVNCDSSFGQEEISHKGFAYQNGEDCRSETEDGEDKSRVNGEDVSIKGEVVEYEERDHNEQFSDATVKDPCQVLLTSEQLLALPNEEIAEKWDLQNEYISFLLSKHDSALQQANSVKEIQGADERLKSQIGELQRKEQYYIMRLATKEHEGQELAAQVEELKALTAGGGSLKHSLLDPAVNLLFERMKRDLDNAKLKMEETQNELAAWKFTPDSNTGKQLMAKCRLLIKENEELGKMISSGKLAKLEGDLALQRNFSDELKKSQSELDEFLQEMDEDTEGMQGTILYLQSQLRQAKERISQLSLQSTSNNNTPASAGDGPEFTEGFVSEIGPQNSNETLLHCIDHERTRYPTPDSLMYKDPDRVEDNSLGAQSNGGTMTDVHNYSLGCEDSISEPSERSRTPFSNSSDRKRTHYSLDEGCEGILEGVRGEEGEGNGEANKPLAKRTRAELPSDNSDKDATSGNILENGLPVE